MLVLNKAGLIRLHALTESQWYPWPLQVLPTLFCSLSLIQFFSVCVCVWRVLQQRHTQLKSCELTLYLFYFRVMSDDIMPSYQQQVCVSTTNSSWGGGGYGKKNISYSDARQLQITYM